MSGRRLVVGVVAIMAITAGLVACRPTFPDGATLMIATEGDGVRISWPAAQTDADKPLASYRIDVDGAEVARLAPVETSCLLSGLTATVDYALEVTAYDSAGQWSGDSGDQLRGRRRPHQRRLGDAVPAVARGRHDPDQRPGRAGGLRTDGRQRRRRR